MSYKEKYNRILLVGDLRAVGTYASNYGATATTEALLDLIKRFSDGAELRALDTRYCKGNSPSNGFPNEPYIIRDHRKSILTKMKEPLKSSNLYKIYQLYKKNIAKGDENNYLPTRFDYFEDYTKKVLNKEILQYESNLIQWADLVIVNSEGSVVHGTNRYGIYRTDARYNMFMEYLVKKVYRKKCYVVNHVVDPNNENAVEMIRNIYPLLDGVIVREHKSGMMLDSYGVHNWKCYPDVLWSHDFENDLEAVFPDCMPELDVTKPYICLGDSSGLLNINSPAKWDVVKTYDKLIKLLRKKYKQIVFVDGFSGGNNDINQVIRRNHLPYVNNLRCNYHELYRVLQGAQIFISGRWHASIIALMAHTPVLVWGGDSHKTQALYSELNSHFAYFDLAAIPNNLDRIVDESERIIARDNSDLWEIVKKFNDLALKNVEMLWETTSENY